MLKNWTDFQPKNVLIQEGFLHVTNTVSLIIDYSSKMQATVEIVASLAKIYASTAVVYFCFNCFIISQQFEMIDDKIIQLQTSHPPADLKNELQFLQNRHLQICRLVQLLNDSFGPILLMEIFFIFTSFTNNIMRILIHFNSYEYYNKIMMLILIVNLCANLALVCHSAERIHTKVCNCIINSLFLCIFWSFLI